MIFFIHSSEFNSSKIVSLSLQSKDSDMMLNCNQPTLFNYILGELKQNHFVALADSNGESVEITELPNYFMATKGFVLINPVLKNILKESLSQLNFQKNYHDIDISNLIEEISTQLKQAVTEIKTKK